MPISYWLTMEVKGEGLVGRTLNLEQPNKAFNADHCLTAV